MARKRKTPVAPKIPKGGSQLRSWAKHYDLDEFIRLNQEQRAEAVSTLQKIFEERAKQLGTKTSIWTESQILKNWLDEYAPDTHDIQETLIDVEKASPNQLLAQFARLQNFFTAKSSTLSGTEAIALEQDKRLFGTHAEMIAGRWVQVANERLTREERKEFWDLYDDYNAMYPMKLESYGSGEIQEVLSDMYMSSDRIELTKAEFLERMRERLRGTNARRTRNIRRGHSEE